MSKLKVPKKHYAVERVFRNYNMLGPAGICTGLTKEEEDYLRKFENSFYNMICTLNKWHFRLKALENGYNKENPIPKP